MLRIGSSWGTDGAALSFELPKVELEITRGAARCRVRELRGCAFLIGSAPDCDVVLGDPRFAEAHSYLLVSPESVTIRHLGLGPGLSVSGQDVTWAALSDQDRVQTGPYQILVRIQWPDSAGGRGAVAGECAFGRENFGGLRLYVDPEAASSEPAARPGCTGCKRGCRKPGQGGNIKKPSSSEGL